MNRRHHLYLFPLLLCLCLLAGAFGAHGEEFNEVMPLTNGPVPPFQDLTLSSEAQNYLVHYPAVGVKAIDQHIAEWAAGLIADAPAAAVSEGENGAPYTLYELQARYSLSASAPRYFSVIFFTTQTIMERRENIIYTLNFDLQGRKAMTLKDIFPQEEEALPQVSALIRQAAAELAAGGRAITLPYYIENYDSYKQEFARFLTLAFCPEGLNIYLSPTDVLLLHKEDLIKSGARSGIW